MTMVVRHSPGSGRLTLGADKAYDVHNFVDATIDSVGDCVLDDVDGSHPGRQRVRGLGAICCRAVGPNPPLVTQLRVRQKR